MVLTIGKDAEVVDELACAHSIHCLNCQRVALTPVILEPFHQMLGLIACGAESFLLVGHHLLVPD